MIEPTEHEAEQPGQRLLPNYIDFVAATNPTWTAITQVLSQEPPIHVNYRGLADVVNRTAWWLDETCLQGLGEGSTLAYVGPSDVRHLIVCLAAVKAGSKALLLSPRNSTAINEHLLAETKCCAIVYDSFFPPSVEEVIARNPHLRTAQISNVEGLLRDSSAVREYPYSETFAMAHAKPLAILHTSGSTGMPRPVPCTHGAMASIDGQRRLHDPDWPDLITQLKIMGEARCPYNAFPLFHIAGLGLGFYILLSGAAMVLGPSQRPPSSEVFKQVVDTVEIDGALLPPSVVNDISQDKSLLETVVPQLLYIFFGGGTITKPAGDLISQRTRLLNSIGSTECGSLPCLAVEAEHWSYFRFHEEQAGLRWDPVCATEREREPHPGEESHLGDDFEMVIYRDERIVHNQAVFQIFPDLTEWRTKDLYSRHPTVPDLWQYRGRADDIIVFSTGEKMNPIPVEDRIRLVPGVRECLVVGNQRPYPILLVEVHGSHDDSHEIVLDDISYAVGELNALNSRDTRLSLADVIVASTAKPFCRLAKGSLCRGETAQLYAQEIERKYGLRNAEDGVAVLDATCNNSLESTVMRLARQLTGVPDLDRHDDLFSLGLDSRQVQELAGALAEVFIQRSKATKFFTTAVYKNPTASGLAGVIWNRILGPLDHAMNPWETFQETLTRHTSQLPSGGRKRLHSRSNKPQHQHILLTGSTGYVGRFFLRALREHAEVEQITCIDRTIRKGGLNETDGVDGSQAPVTHLQGDLSKPQLGLKTTDYAELLYSVTTVVHCQWPVDFNWPLSSFDPHLSGVVNLIHFAQRSQHHARIIFLSSIASVKGWSGGAGGVPVPEHRILPSPEHAQTGYGESKLLAGELFHQAGAAAGVHSVICRIGQVAGPVRTAGMWPARDWFPALLRASREVGCIPDSLGTANGLDWIPVDVLAELLVDLATTTTTGDVGGETTTYYHLVNPVVTPYQEAIQGIAKRMGDGCRVVSLSAWIRALERQGTEGVPLLGFFQSLLPALGSYPVHLETCRTIERLPRLGRVEPVNAQWMDMWLDQWGFV